MADRPSFRNGVSMQRQETQATNSAKTPPTNSKLGNGYGLSASSHDCDASHVRIS